MKIGCIGLGNMADAIIGGMLRNEIIKKEDIIGSAKTEKTIERMKKKYDIHVTLDNRQVAKEAEVLILAVKPQFMEEVAAQIRDCVSEDALLVTIAAGKTMAWYEKAFGRKIRLVRCMPNTPALVGEGCTALCANDEVTEEEFAFVEKLMGSLGKTLVIRESLIDAFAAVAGSSPAYVFMFIEAMADGGVAAGLPRSLAYEAAAQAVLGSAKLLSVTGRHPGELKDMVCSPGGTTIEAVRVLEEKGMRGAVMDAIAACVEKTKKL